MRLNRNKAYLYNVPHCQFANLDLLCGSISNDIEFLLALNSILEAAKLFLLGPIIEGCDNDNNDDCDQDGGPFDVPVLILVLLSKSGS